MEAVHQDKRYTYDDYKTWIDDVRYELIDGIPYMMAPPNRKHEDISGAIFYQLYGFLKGKPCRVYDAPFGVRLNANEDTVVEPDIVVVCDNSKLNDDGCVGAPDLVMEILSKSTLSYDKVVKFNKYLQAGVREYWIIEPEGNIVNVHILENGKYVTTAYAETDIVPVHVLEGCKISLPDVFMEISVT